MSTGIYIGVNGVARKVKTGYIGIGGVARKIKKGYIGINGVARLFYSAEDKLKASGYVSTGTDRTDGVIKPYIGKYASTAVTGKVINSSLTITNLSSTTASNCSMRGNTNTYMYGFSNTGNHNDVTGYKAVFRFVDSNLTETVSGSLSSHRWLATPCASASKQSTYSIITLTNYYQAVYAITNSKTFQQLSTTTASAGDAGVGCIDAYQLKIGGTPSNNNGYMIGSKYVDVYNSNMTKSTLTLPSNYPYGKSSASLKRQNAVASTDLGVLVRSAIDVNTTWFINKSLTITAVPNYTTGNDPDARSIGFKTLCVTTPGRSGVNSVYVTHVDTMTTETVATSNYLYERCYLSHNDDTVFVGGGMVSDDRNKYYRYICGLKLA